MRSSQNPALLRALAAEIRARRGEQGISQDELALRAGLSRTFLGKIEIAQNQPSLTAFMKMADGLGTAAPELLDAVVHRLAKEEAAARRAARKAAR